MHLAMNTPKLQTLLLGLSLTLTAQCTYAAASFDCLIEPTQTVDVSSPVVGLLEKVHVRRGDKVRKGQVLANLESNAEIAAAELARYKSELVAPTQTAESKIEFAKRKFERRKDMHAEKFMSEQEVDEAENELKLAQSELKMARENREIAKLEWRQQSSQLELRTIRSPFDGVVIDQSIYPGEVVEPSGQKKNILKLAQLNPLRVYVIMPMNAFGKVKQGMKVDVNPELPVGGRYEGTVNIIDRIVDAASGTFGVFLEVPNPRMDVPAGVKCKADFPIEPDATGKIAAPLRKSAASPEHRNQ
jgi:RND family efflux transporter MFP subunit